MRFIFNPSTGNLESADNVTSPLKTLGEKFKVAELTNMNTPDLEQSPDSFLRPGETLEEWDVTFRRPNAYGGLQREGFALGTIKVKSKGSKNYGKWLVKDFWTKANGAMPNPDGSGKRNAYFKSETAALKAIEQRNLKMKELTGRWSGKDLNAHYKDEIKFYGYEGTDWKKIPNKEKSKIIQKYVNKTNPRPSIAKWKKEGLSRRVNEETRRLLELHKPVNPKTGSPYTLKEWTTLSGGVRGRILNQLKGKPRRMDRRWADTKEGWYPDKNDNRLLNYMKHAAKQQEELRIPLKERTYLNVYEIDPKLKKGKRFIGVKEVNTNTLWTHVDYDLTQPGAKNGKVITKHPDMPRFLKFFNEAQKFKYERPTALLKDYFAKYSKVPTYNEIYNFFNMHAKTKPHIYKKHNALTLHHQNLMRNKPTKNFQLLINKYNTQADNILRNSLKKPGQKGYITKAEAIRQLKAIGARVEGMGIKASEITPKKGLDLAKKEAIKEFKAAIKKNPQIVDQMAKKLGLDKKQEVILRKRLNSGIPLDIMGNMLSSELKIPVGKIMGALGKVAKVAGPLTLPLDVIPFAQARDLGIENWGEVGGKTWVQEFQKLPRTLEDLLHVAGEGTWEDFGEKEDRLFTYEPSTWGDKASVKALRETSNEEIIETIKNQVQEPDIAYGQQAFDPLLIGDNLEKRIQKALEQKAWADSLSPNHPLVKEEEVEIKETENVFGTQIPMKSITEGFSRDEFLAKGGRVGFADGTPNDDKSDEEILEWIKSQMFELEQGWNTGKSVPGKIMDVARVDNWPYYAARMLRAGMSVAEVSAKLPFVGIELLQKLATRPAFKVVPADTDYSSAQVGLGEKYMEGVDDSWLTDRPHNKLEGQGLFKEAFGKLMPGYFADKTGLNSLIEDMEAKMIAQGQSKWPVIAGSNVELGLDVTLPFGYVAAANKYKALKKMLSPVVAGKSVDNVIEEALTDQGMSRRDFNKLLVTGGVITALKTLGLDKLFKGMSRNPIPGPIKMVERSTSKMPLWFPKFIDKINDKMTYRGDGMWDFKGTEDFLPGFHIERVGDDYYITGKNQYEQDFQITYNSPKWEGDADGSYYNHGEFIVEDSVPVGRHPEDVDFDGEVVDEVHDVLGNTKEMEEIATGQTIKGTTKGEDKVIEAEVKAEQSYDMAKDEGYFDEVE